MRKLAFPLPCPRAVPAVAGALFVSLDYPTEHPLCAGFLALGTSHGEGRLRAEMSDLPVNVITTQGVKLVDLSEQERSVAASHVNAATHYRDTGETDRLASFRELVVGGVELETDPR